MSETVKLCAMLVRHVFDHDDETRDEEMRRPFVEQAMRAKREHDEMRTRLAAANEHAEQADTTRREWEVRAATSYRDGRAAGLREAAGVCMELGGNALSIAWVNAADECERRIRALAPPAAETVRVVYGQHANGCRSLKCCGCVEFDLPASEPRDEGES